MHANGPAAEARDRLGGKYETRVLEPSPPAVNDEPWFADDPAARGDVPADVQVVSPVSSGDLLWADVAEGDPELASWCRERWLGPWRRLQPLPDGFDETRRSLHRLAEHVVAPARQAANGKIGLRYTRGGFGTPFFGNDKQVRVEGTTLVVEEGGRQPLRSALALDDGSAEAVANWFGFAASVLEELRARAGADLDASRVQIWPEHFDMAVDLGSEEQGARAGYGCSPGDEEHPEPYAYVTPWTARPEGELWNATAFPGAELPYSELLAATDQRAVALDFFRVRLRALTGEEL